MIACVHESNCDLFPLCNLKNPILTLTLTLVISFFDFFFRIMILLPPTIPLIIMALAMLARRSASTPPESFSRRTNSNSMASIPRGAAAARLEAGARQLKSVGPRAVLARGYAWTLDDDGRLVRSIEDVAVGARLTTILGDGRLQSTVDGAAQKNTQQ